MTSTSNRGLSTIWGPDFWEPCGVEQASPAYKAMVQISLTIVARHLDT